MSPWACTTPAKPVVKPIVRAINILNMVLLEFKQGFMGGSDKIRK